MKKNYQAPQIEIVQMESVVMAATSGDINSNSSWSKESLPEDMDEMEYTPGATGIPD